MNQELKQKWVTALRSGEYKQGIHNLNTDAGFCCLGVLCDLYSKETGEEWVLDAGTGTNYMFNDCGLLPNEVTAWSGVSKDGALPDTLTDRRTINVWLSYLNDSGFTFNQIADIIEYAL